MADKTETPVKEKVEEAKDAQAEVPAGAEGAAEAPKPAVRKKKVKRSVPYGQLHVFATFNNTIITITDSKGAKLTGSSAGACGFRGSKKGTAYAAQVAAEKAIESAKQQYGLSKVDVYIKGIGLGRDAAVRTLGSSNVSVDSIKDVTTIAHGGVRPKKARRV